MEKLDPLYIAGEEVKWCSCSGNRFGGSSEVNVEWPCMHAAKLLHCAWLFATHQSPSVHGILQARILQCSPPPGDRPNPGIKLRSPTLQAGYLPSEPPDEKGMKYWNTGSVDESWKNHAKGKKPVTKGHIMYHSLYIKYWDVKSRDTKISISSYQVLGKGCNGQWELNGYGVSFRGDENSQN